MTDTLRRAERIARKLSELDMPPWTIDKARFGEYDEFRSTRANPHHRNLIAHAMQCERPDVARLAQAGAFDDL
jgi:hypothetical protein